MYTIQDVIERTGLKANFIRRCVKGISCLQGHTKNGDKNRTLFDSNAFVIFDKIKQYKEEGLTIQRIDEELVKLEKQPDKQVGKHYQTVENESERNHQESLSNQDNQVLQLTQNLHETEKAKMEAEHRLELIQSTQKLLPAGGDVEKSRKMLALIHKLEVLTRPKGIKLLSKTREIEKLWADLKELL